MSQSTVFFVCFTDAGSLVCAELPSCSAAAVDATLSTQRTDMITSPIPQGT